MTDELTLQVGGRRLAGWTQVAVTRGIEQMPGAFVIEATEASPVMSDAVAVQAGESCTVSLGGDLALTGYVDTVAPAYGPGGHSVTIQGRGKCQDLVDCSAEWKSCQISGASALEIAQKLATPYGIRVSAPDGPGDPIPQFNINVTDTPASILELVTRSAQLLYYEDPAGNLVLAQAGKKRAGSGFVEGQNVQAAAVLNSMAQRYSDYTCSLLSVSNSSLFGPDDGLFFFSTTDPNVKRHRRLVTVAESVGEAKILAQRRAIWDAARRAGRGRQVNVTVDSWRDGKGKLWAPNTLAPVTLPRLKVKESGLCISQVTYRLGLQGGRTADVTLMPKEAFQPQPVQLQEIIPGTADVSAVHFGG